MNALKSQVGKEGRKIFPEKRKVDAKPAMWVELFTICYSCYQKENTIFLPMNI
jgi:hypothetical protein